MACAVPAQAAAASAVMTGTASEGGGGCRKRSRSRRPRWWQSVCSSELPSLGLDAIDAKDDVSLGVLLCDRHGDVCMRMHMHMHMHT